jgi:hypothetical protein
VKEFKQEVLLLIAMMPVIHCKAFKENSGVVALAKEAPKRCPQLKNINTKYHHHFRKYVANGFIKVLQVSMDDQIMNILTKNLRLPSVLLNSSKNSSDAHHYKKPSKCEPWIGMRSQGCDCFQMPLMCAGLPNSIKYRLDSTVFNKP